MGQLTLTGDDNFHVKYDNLELIHHYRMKYLKSKHDFMNRIYDFEMKFNHDEFYFMDYNQVIHGVLCVNTTDSLKNWFSKYHESFVNAFDLKLIRVSTNFLINQSYREYKIFYTYKNNENEEELPVEEVMKYEE